MQTKHLSAIAVLLISLVAVPCLGQIMMMPVETPIFPMMPPSPFYQTGGFPFGSMGGSYVDPYQSAWTQQSTWGPQTWDQSSWMMNSGLSQYPTGAFGTTSMTDPFNTYNQFNTGALTQTGYPNGMYTQTGYPNGMYNGYPYSQTTQWNTQYPMTSTFNGAVQTSTATGQTQG